MRDFPGLRAPTRRKGRSMEGVVGYAAILTALCAAAMGAVGGSAMASATVRTGVLVPARLASLGESMALAKENLGSLYPTLHWARGTYHDPAEGNPSDFLASGEYQGDSYAFRFVGTTQVLGIQGVVQERALSDLSSLFAQTPGSLLDTSGNVGVYDLVTSQERLQSEIGMGQQPWRARTIDKVFAGTRVEAHYYRTRGWYTELWQEYRP